MREINIRPAHVTSWSEQGAEVHAQQRDWKVSAEEIMAQASLVLPCEREELATALLAAAHPGWDLSKIRNHLDYVTGGKSELDLLVLLALVSREVTR